MLLTLLSHLVLLGNQLVTKGYFFSQNHPLKKPLAEVLELPAEPVR